MKTVVQIVFYYTFQCVARVSRRVHEDKFAVTGIFCGSVENSLAVLVPPIDRIARPHHRFVPVVRSRFERIGRKIATWGCKKRHTYPYRFENEFAASDNFLDVCVVGKRAVIFVKIAVIAYFMTVRNDLFENVGILRDPTSAHKKSSFDVVQVKYCQHFVDVFRPPIDVDHQRNLFFSASAIDRRIVVTAEHVCGCADKSHRRNSHNQKDKHRVCNYMSKNFPFHISPIQYRTIRK